MSSSALFPVELEHEEPTSGTYDLKSIGYCSSGVKYAVKRESDAPLLPLAEWVGHKLSEFCGIRTPMYDVVRCMDGQLAFGSRWKDSARQIGPFGPKAIATLSAHAQAISRIFGLDFFLPNPDRHINNFLFAQEHGQEVCISFDFGWGSVRHGLPFGAPPLDSMTKTVLVRRLLTQQSIFHPDLYNESLAAVGNVTTAQIKSALDEAPDEWYTKVTKAEIVDWWETFKNDRIAMVTT